MALRSAMARGIVLANRPHTNCLRAVRMATPCAYMPDMLQPNAVQRRWFSEEKPISPEVEAILDKIVKLNLEQVSELVNGLNTRLDLPDTPAMGAMPMMGMHMGGGAPAAAAPEEEAVEELKPIVSVQLDSFDAASKIKLIKEVKSISGLGLKEAKAAVEGAPGVIVKDIKREEATAIVASIEALGGKASLV